MTSPTSAEYFQIASLPRYRATRRGRIRGGARQGMLLAGGLALLNCAWLGALHPDAWLLILATNASIAVSAAVAYVALGSVASRRPEVVVFGELLIVDLATVALALGNPALGLVAAGFVLLLPIVVALLIPWATRAHVSWLVLHVALVVTYAAVAAAPDRPGARMELLGLLAAAVLASQVGHVSGLRHQATTFVQVEQIRALNRQARRDRTRLDALNLALAESASTDALTGLGNRLALDAGIRLARSRIERQREAFGLMILDLDHFKAINDERGHLGGDDVLRAVGRTIGEHIRPGDSAYRYGGEEFVVLVRVTQPAEALVAAERIRRAIENLHVVSPTNNPYGVLTVSIGVATIDLADLGLSDTSLLARADVALYRAKAEGRNRCERERAQPISVRRVPRASQADRRPQRASRSPAEA